MNATKDANARVRARAINSLASSNDTALASFYEQFLNDQSYGVIRAAATALGLTKDSSAFQSLTRLMEVPSWRGTIRASALEGLAASGDARALDIGFRFVAEGNEPQVRAAALKILGNLGKNDLRVFPVISETLRQAFNRIDFNLILAASEALVNLGDPRGLPVFEELSKNVGDIPQFQEIVGQFVERLKKSQVQAASPAQKP
jgi:aminopeptidase N